MKYYLVIIFSLFLLYSCFEQFYSGFDNYDEMIKSSSYKGGWIPKNIPSSAKNIHEWHDLDTNLGYGSFNFDTVDFDNFIAKMDSIQTNKIMIDPIFDNRNNWDYDLDKYPDFEEIYELGFEIYKFDRFYIAANSKNGHSFFWHK